MDLLDRIVRSKRPRRVLVDAQNAVARANEILRRSSEGSDNADRANPSSEPE
jgi:hypothetical protein